MNKLVFAIFAAGVILYGPCTFASDTVEDATEVYTDTSGQVKDIDRFPPQGLHGILGAGIFSSQRIIGNGERRTGPLPIILMTYKGIAYWSLGGGGLWLVQNADRSLRLGMGVRIHSGWDGKDDPGLVGMQKRKTSLDGYLNAVWRNPLSTIGARYYHDILNGNRGDAASLRISHGFTIVDGLRLTPSIGADWQNTERVDYYYGVRPEEELPFRPAYSDKGTINANAGVTAFYRLPGRWSLLAGLFATRFGRGVVDSPIVTRRYSATAYVGGGVLF